MNELWSASVQEAEMVHLTCGSDSKHTALHGHTAGSLLGKRSLRHAYLFIGSPLDSACWACSKHAQVIASQRIQPSSPLMWASTALAASASCTQQQAPPLCLTHPLQWACTAPAASAGMTPRQPASSLSQLARQLPLTQASCAAWGRSPAQRCELWAPTSGRRQSVSGRQHCAMLEVQGHTWPILSLMLHTQHSVGLGLLMHIGSTSLCTWPHPLQEGAVGPWALMPPGLPSCCHACLPAAAWSHLL